jgi:hypothetical protein
MIGMKLSVHQPFRRARAGGLLGAAGMLALAACNGSGGGATDSVPPTITAASFGGAGPGPVAGDVLVLLFSEDVQLPAGPVDDADLVLSGGGTLGAATTVTDQPTPRSLRLTLGAGATFAPGTTTIGLAPTNTVFRDAAGNLGTGGTPVVIDSSDGSPPTITNLTIAGVDAALNGTGTAGGTLQVPENGWSIDLAYVDTGVGVDPTRTQLSASVTVSTSAGSQPPGTDLLSFLTPTTATATVGSYTVPASVTFPAGALTLTCVVVDAGGLSSMPATFVATVRHWSDPLQPFETTVNPQQVWFLELDRDIESFTTTAIAGGASVDIVAVQNGRSDFLDILFVLGLQHTAPIPNVSGSDDSNAVALGRFQAALLADLQAFVAGANIQFTFTPPSGSFGNNSSLPYASLGYSQICIAGSSDTPGVLGIAQFDPNNQRQNDDCLLEGASSSRLGVFLHTIADSGLGPPSGSTFRAVFNNFAPAVGGQPIGSVAGDDQRLLGALGDARETRMDEAIADLARFTAVVVAHECGHSMGLVANGAMPNGLYGNDPNFPGSNPGHIRNQALFPTGTNIMSPLLAYSSAIDPATAFNSLNLAYLREQVFYGN